MGTLLEMSRGIAPALALLAVLGACGEDREAQALGLVARIQGLLPTEADAEADVGTQRSPGSRFSAEAIAAEPEAYRLVQINALGLSEPARIVAASGNELTLELQSGRTAAFDGGILVSTRGFGDDLLTMESRGVLETLRAGGGNVTRKMETLDSLDQIHTAEFSCTISAAGSEVVNLGLREVTLRRFNENCRSDAIIFDNIYWLDGSGSILASRQYVSPGVAYLRSNQL